RAMAAGMVISGGRLPRPQCASGAVSLKNKNNYRQFARPQDRPRLLREWRSLKMARSAHAYIRGNAGKFYEWLEADRCAHPQGPAVWICGDCHIGNLGPVAGADDKVEIQIRDLDQAVIGNPAHDLIRWGLCFATAAR